MKKQLALAAAALVAVGFPNGHCRAAEYYVAPAGLDSGAGTQEQPFATLQRAQQAAAPGDTVFIRGGTYRLREEQIAQRQKIWATITLLDKNGLPGKPIRYWAFDNERPIFDCSLIKPSGYRVTAFHVTASWLHLKGLEVTGVQVTLTNHAQSICFENSGNHNLYERLSMHDGMAIGIYSVRGANNLFLNCDAYRNYDPVSDGGFGGNVDGFGCHPGRGGTNNVFRGCRAWFNSDDGFDCINAHEAVAFENCWAFCNGYSPTFKSLADGNGFKAGGYGSTPASRLPRSVPRHTIRDCLAVRNKANGFYANHHPGGCDWLGNIACRNGANFNMQGRLADNRTEVPGYGHVLKNNVSIKGGASIRNIDTNRCELADNAFDSGRTRSGQPLATLDENALAAPRAATGDLPDLGLARLRQPASPQ